MSENRTKLIGIFSDRFKIESLFNSKTDWTKDQYRNKLFGLEATESILIYYDIKNPTKNLSVAVCDRLDFINAIDPIVLYIKKLIHRDVLVRAFAARLPPGCKIKMHTDPAEFSECVRVHWVFETNDKCQMVFRRNKIHFKKNELWIFDNMVLHGAKNDGESHRIHFIFDLK